MISRRRFLAGCLPLALGACSSRDIVNAIEGAVRSGSLSGAVRSVATSKATGWARNPKSLLNDLNDLEGFAQKFLKEVIAEWGEEDSEAPSKTVFVKYSDDYKSRSVIDFDAGVVRVETLIPDHLKQAIITTVLSPQNPQDIDLFSADPVKLGGEPFLYNQIVDHEGKAIRWEWRAARFADYLTAQKKETREIQLKNGEKRLETRVSFPLLSTHTSTRQNRYAGSVNRHAARYGIERALVYAVIQTESNFNPYAVSWVPAYGLMQIVPKTAGRDAFEVIHGRSGTPSRDYLFDADKNIRMGCAYLYVLKDRYLVDVKNSTSKEYCMIAGYNGGVGNVLRSFHQDRRQAIALINRSSPTAVYRRLKTKMPKESQRYLDKVLKAKSGYA